MEIGLVCISVVPLVVEGGYFSIWLMSTAEEKNEQFANHTAAFVGEALSGAQTIAALTREKTILDEFSLGPRACNRSVVFRRYQP